MVKLTKNIVKNTEDDDFIEISAEIVSNIDINKRYIDAGRFPILKIATHVLIKGIFEDLKLELKKIYESEKWPTDFIDDIHINSYTNL